MPKMDRTLIGIVLLAVGFAFLSGALLQTAPTPSSERAFEQWGPSFWLPYNQQPPGQPAGHSAGFSVVFTPAFSGEPTGFSVVLGNQLNESTSKAIRGRLTCGGEFGTDRLIVDETWGVAGGGVGYWGPWTSPGQPGGGAWANDNPDLVAGETCKLTVTSTSHFGPGDVYHFAMYAGGGTLKSYVIVWAKRAAQAPTTPGVTGPSDSPVDAVVTTGTTETCEPEQVVVDGACVAKPAELSVWLILGILILLIIVGAAVILLGVFG